MAAGEAIVAGAPTRSRSARLHHLHGLRAPHAGGNVLADADAAHDDRGAAAAQGANPYIVVLTNPTTGGVTASYAMLAMFNRRAGRDHRLRGAA